MKKFIKLSSAALLASSLVIATNVMAVGAPNGTADSASLTKAVGANTGAINVLTNDNTTGVTVTNLSVSTPAKYGTAVCGVAPASATTCHYTVGANSVGKTSDSFVYAYNFEYTDHKNRIRKGVARGTVTVALNAGPASP